MVELVEVDVVGREALQARIEGAADVQGGKPGFVGPVLHGAVNLGGEHRPLPALAALGEPAAQNFLGPAPVLGAAVDVGRVKEIDARVQRGIHDRVGGRLLCLRPKIHGAQAEAGNLQARAAQLAVLHGRSFRTLTLQPEPEFDRHLPVGYLAVLEVPADLLDLEPVQVPQGFEASAMPLRTAASTPSFEVPTISEML